MTDRSHKGRLTSNIDYNLYVKLPTADGDFTKHRLGTQVGFARQWNPTSFGAGLNNERTCQWRLSTADECGELSSRGNYCAKHAAIMYNGMSAGRIDP